jgi:hypothetical protein
LPAASRLKAILVTCLSHDLFCVPDDTVDEFRGLGGPVFFGHHVDVLDNAVHQLIHYSLDHGLHHISARRILPGPDKKPLKLSLADLAESLPHLAYKRPYVSGFEPIHELGGALVDQGHAFGDILFTGLAVLFGHLRELVDAVKINVLYLVDCRFKVSWYGNINYQQRLIPAAANRFLQRRLAEQVILRCC